jgi:hypothetical protein
MQEYIRMFDLKPDELRLKILDCGGGPASFNAEMTQQGYSVISSDPIYQFTAAEIAQRVQDTYQSIIYGTKVNYDRFVWQDIPSPEELGKIRMTSMNKFIDDFSLGLQQGRYVADELPNLSFESNSFDLALCSHFLFTYSNNLSLDFHITAISEMCRVAKEVRIFPLLVQFSGEVSPWLEPIMDEMQYRGYEVEIRQVSYEFQKGGDRYIKLTRNI